MFFIYPKTQELYELYNAPVKNHTDDSGIDLYIPDTVQIWPFETVLIDLKVVCTLEEEDSTRKPFLVIPRSSIYKTPLMMKNSVGLIDSGYNGTLKVPVINLSKQVYILEKHTRLVQMMKADLSFQTFQVKDLHTNPNETTRGEGGFGSTGI